MSEVLSAHQFVSDQQAQQNPAQQIAQQNQPQAAPAPTSPQTPVDHTGTIATVISKGISAFSKLGKAAV